MRREETGEGMWARRDSLGSSEPLKRVVPHKLLLARRPAAAVIITLHAARGIAVPLPAPAPPPADLLGSPPRPIPRVLERIGEVAAADTAATTVVAFGAELAER